MEVNLHHVANMRNDRQAVGQCQIRGLPPFRYPCQAHDIRLNIMYGAGSDERAEMVEQIELLAQCDGGCYRFGQATVAIHIIVPKRLFEECYIEVDQVRTELLSHR